MSTYLSLDIDFFNKVRCGDQVLAAYLDDLILAAGVRDIPLQAVMNHHQMLPLVDASGATSLINIDLHSDLAGEDCGWFNCGTWVSYCKCRQRGHYHWIASGTVDDGECSHDQPIWRLNGNHRGHLTDWASIQRTARKTPPSIGSLFGASVPSPIVAVGICLSPGYSDWELQEVFHDWRRRYGVPYKRGRRDEYGMGVERSPK